MPCRTIQTRLCRTAFFLSFLLIIANCATIHRDGDLPLVENEQQAVFALIAQKEDAIRSGDIDRFLAVLNRQMPEYAIEQQHWFQYYQNADVSELRLEPVDIAKRDANTYIVTLRQQYLYGANRTKRECRFNQKYIRTPLGWKDSDLEFQERKTAHFHLMAVDTVSEDKLETIAENAETAFRLVQQAYGDVPQDITLIKIYDDPYLVRELTKVSAERTMHGWYEYPESIKIAVRKSNRYAYTRTLAHELMHKTSLSKARNQCPWFAEGLAVYFGTFQALGGTYIDRGWLTTREHVHPISWLEEKNPENLTERSEESRFYGTSGMVVKHIEACYGRGKSKDLVAALSRFPQTDEGFEYQKQNALYTRQLHEAIQATLGVDSATFNDRWLAWIKTQHQP